ncbi:hypothetical protein ACGFZQ_22895 [Streptomyces sp. NPDC048254]|uniref:hypothetical protein n=1 Tax=Streptomyces sp. NPDC048254 TaxID=3365525 RepID=UPI0037125749
MTHRTARPPVSEGPVRPAAEYEPTLGDTVEDTARYRIGKVMGAVGGYVQLRPIGGGREWDASPEYLRPVSAADALRGVVATENARSRGALW